MTCPRCGHENRSDARFCGGCGAGLVAEHACGACGRPNPPGQRFCDGCGRPLGASAEGVRKPEPRAYTPNHLAEKILSAQLARRRGDEAARERELREAQRLFTEMGATARAAQVARELAC